MFLHQDTWEGFDDLSGRGKGVDFQTFSIQLDYVMVCVTVYSMATHRLIKDLTREGVIRTVAIVKAV